MTGATATQLRHGAVVTFAHALVSAVLNRLLHARDSRHVQTANEDLVASLGEAERLGCEMPLRLQFDSDRIYHDGDPLEGPSLQARSLLDHCERRDIGVLSFARGFDASQCNRLLDLLLLDQNLDALQRNRRSQTLRAFGVRSVEVTGRRPADPGDERGDGEQRAMRRYQDLAAVLQQNHRLAHRDQELMVDATSTAIERTLLDLDEPSLLLSLAMQDDVDRFTVGHSVRVALLALQVARAVGADRQQLVRIGAAALMHDIGKSKVPQEILFKQGSLTDDEWRWMAQHPRLGAQLLLEQHETVDPTAIGAAFCHHMGADGVGYPRPELAVPPSATSKLIRVCDVFEALTAVRPYKQALSPVEAYAVMFRTPGDFDQRWLRRFTRTLGLFPNGTRVELDDGSQALVVGQTQDVRRPRLRLLSGPDGADLPADHPGEVRVGEAFEGRDVRIGRIQTHERIVDVPDLDDGEPLGSCRSAHDACLGNCGDDAHRHDPDAT